MNLTPTSKMDAQELTAFLKKSAMSLTHEEVRMIEGKLGRDPTLTELYIFNIEWSEHCSYKSSRRFLKQFPTKAPNVILGPSEDAGIIDFTTVNGIKWGIALRQESHNHPSHIVPYEGAATGVGGIVRDILCMGARIIGLTDPLRFGNPALPKTKYIASTVIDGIAGYGNAIGIPNLGGDVCFNPSYDENCLVNVACIGIVREDEIIHSLAPSGAAGYDIVLVGKATDNSGFGGAAFASVIMDAQEENKGAVQVPDPFLKNVLIRASYAAFAALREQKITAGFKDCGAGGIMCATSELCAAGNMGAKIDVDKIPVSMDLPPYITACSETQERMVWIVPTAFTPTLLRIYNEDFALPQVAQGACAAVIGTVTEEKNYVLTARGETICDAPILEVTEGITYDRPIKARARTYAEPDLPEPTDYREAILAVLHHPNVASKIRAYKHYDLDVLGNAVLRPGEADAGMIKPLEESDAGLAISSDCNPRYARIDPYHGAVNAVVECMRNLAAVGSTPSGFTNCLNFGSPENPEVLFDFSEAIRGITDACTNIHHKGHGGCVPIISGNVSFYNESSTGNAIDPSPHITGLGIIDDIAHATGVQVRAPGNLLFLIGERKDELGGSIHYDLHGEVGANVPLVDFSRAKAEIYTVIDLINAGIAQSCHDISDGGIAATLAEMLLGANGTGKLGANVTLESSLRTDTMLFTETGGFVIEIPPDKAEDAQRLAETRKIALMPLGTVTATPELTITHAAQRITISNADMARAWLTGFSEAIE